MQKFFIIVVSVFIALASCSEQKPKTIEYKFEGGQIVIPEEAIGTPSGLKYIDVTIGDGVSPQKGQMIAVHYTGKLMDGKQFDSSYDRNTTLDFQAGVGMVIPGFDEGLMTMKVGGKRILYIPSNLGYGAQGAPGAIPPNADLIFEVELVAIK